MENNVCVGMSKEFECETDLEKSFTTCPHIFSSELSFTEHLKLHSNGQFKCKWCFGTFPNESSLKVHTVLHLQREQCQFQSSKDSPNFYEELRLQISALNESFICDEIQTNGKSENLVCDFCLKSFDTKHRFKWHMRCHSGKKTYRCPLCSAAFQYISALNTHLAVHENRKPHKCSMCKLSFSFRRDLQMHTLTHYDERDLYKCKICGRAFIQRESLKKHMVTHAVNSVKCNLCTETFSHRGSWRRHMLLHSDEKLHKCHLCPRAYRMHDSLKVHIALHYEEGLLKNDSNRYLLKCKLCAAEFHSKIDLKQHTSLHKDEGYLKCLICSKKYKHILGLKKHMSLHMLEGMHCKVKYVKSTTVNFRKKISTETPENEIMRYKSSQHLRCCLCKKGFIEAAEFKSHLADHFGEPLLDSLTPSSPETINLCRSAKITKFDKKAFHRCGECLKIFKTRSYLERHKALHIDRKQFKCHLCTKLFSFYHELRNHMVKHAEGKSYSCCVCLVVYDIEEDLQEHILSHHEETLFKCNECKKTYISKSELKRHMQSHLNESLFKCGVCKKSLKSSQNLKQHLSEEHSVKGLFKCCLCKKALKTKRCVERHSALHSLDKFYTCLACDQTYERQEDLDEHILIHSTSNDNMLIEISDVEKSDNEMERLSMKFCAVDYIESADEGLYIENASISKESKLLVHLGVVYKEVPIKCDLCQKEFKQHDSLKHHMLSHCSEKPYQCHLCFKFFKYYSSLEQHHGNHSQREPHKCSLCPAVFSLKGALVEHFINHIADGNEYKCYICDGYYANTDSLRSHLRVHSYENVIEGQVIKEFSENSDVLKKIVADEHTDSNFIPKISKSKVLRGKNSVTKKNKLKQKRHSQHKKVFSKETQHKTYDYNIENHITTVPRTSLQKPQKQQVPRKDSLNPNEDPFICKFCSRRYPSLHRLKWHMTEHLSEPSECSTLRDILTFNKSLEEQNYQPMKDDIDQMVEEEDDWDIENIIDEQRAKEQLVHFRCTICHKEYESESGVIEHVFMHSNDMVGDNDSEKVVNIDIVYSDRGEFEDDCGPDFRSFDCQKCSQKFETEVDLIAHDAEHAVKLFTCKVCQKSFKWKESLKLHMNLHLEEKPFKCHLCSKSFIYRLNLRQHLYSHFDDKLPSCEEKEYKKKMHQEQKVRDQEMQMVEQHKDQHKQSSPKQEENWIKNTFGARDELTQIQASVAEQKCDRICGTNSQLSGQSKYKLENARKEDVFECHICPKIFQKKGELKYHLISHSNEKIFKCHLCPKSFKYKSALKRHLLQDSLHNKNRTKPFSCYLCDQSFNEASHLKHHMLCHSERKAYQCHVCGKSYKHIFSLRRHFSEEHVEKKFLCNVCSKDLKTKSSLENHLQLHLEEKLLNLKSTFDIEKQIAQKENPHYEVEEMFECHICRETYSNIQKLEKHISTHRENRVNCNSERMQERTVNIHDINMQIIPDKEDEGNHNANVKSVVQKEEIDLSIGLKDSVCQKYLGNFKQIMQKLSGSEGVEWKCRICYKTCKNKTHIKRHALSHLKKKVFVCKYCYKKYKSPYTLKKHIIRTHKDKKSISRSSMRDMEGNETEYRGSIEKNASFPGVDKYFEEGEKDD